LLDILFVVFLLLAANGLQLGINSVFSLVIGLKNTILLSHLILIDYKLLKDASSEILVFISSELKLLFSFSE